jgi:Holliday junction resolvase
MSRQSRGLQKENEIAKEIYEGSGGTVIPVRAGYSGNAAVPLPDLLIPVAGSLRAVELKTSSQDRLYIDHDAIDQVVDWSMDMTEIPTFPYLAVKFNNYEVYTGRIQVPWDLDTSFRAWASDTPFEASVTDSGKLSIKNPTKMTRTERDRAGIVSAQKSPGDGTAMINDLKYDEYANTTATEQETVSVYDVLKEMN